MSHSLHGVGQEAVVSKKIEDQLTCPVCLEPYKDPRALPCLHSFCAGCLEQLPHLDSKTEATHQLSCPTCRNVTDLPQQGVEGFHKAHHLNNLMEVHEMMKKASGEESTICESCKKESSTVYCRDCEKFYCEPCNKIHKMWPLTASHEVISTREAYRTASKMVPAKPAAELKCPSHDKPLDLYCVTCEEPICYHCTIKSHKGHAHDLVVDAYEECKTIMKERIRTLVKNIKETEKKQADIQQSKKEIQEKGGKCKASVNELCDEFIQKIEKVRTLGLQCVDDGVSAYVQFEDRRLKIVDTELSAQNGCKEVAETTMENSTPSQLLAMKKDVMAGIDRLLPTPKPHRPVVPSRSADMPPTPISDIYAMPTKKPNKNPQIEIPHKHAPTGDLYALPTKKPTKWDVGDLYALPTKKPTKWDVGDVYALPTKKPTTGDLYALPTKTVPTPIVRNSFWDPVIPKQHTTSIPPVPSRSVQDQAVVNLREKIFSTVNFDYPEEALKQFKCVLDIPDEILIGKVSTGTFVLSYMGKSVVVDKDKITCCFESTTSSGDIICETDYFTKDNVVKYQIVFTTPELKKDGDFRFTLKIGSFVFSTNKFLKVVLDHDAVQSTFVQRVRPRNLNKMTMYSTIDH